MQFKSLFVILIIAIFLGACSGENTMNEDVSKPNNDIDVKALVNDYSIGHIKDQSASITSRQLIITESDDNKIIYDLPEEEFFVSIAPFINETHPCTNHSLTGCQGEMVDKDLDFYIEDKDGHVIMDETINSDANGFVDLWLPRDQTFQVKITYDGKTSESEVSTFDDDGTCITTMQIL